MANTTNFGWETPDDTDLVKDGAAAIRTLGSAIDTSLVDLKGGTTGQVLSKASNTDMDFTWSSVDPLTILDAKGDLISATAADTPARLASSGVNGDVLQVDTSTATGLKWAAPSSGSLTLLSTTTLSGTSTTISSISSAYTHLQVVLYGVNVNTSNTVLRVAPNASTNITTGVRNNGSGGMGTDPSSYLLLTCGGTTHTFGRTDNAFVFNIFNYSSTATRKPYSASGGYYYADNAASQPILAGGFIDTTSAISSLVISNSSGNSFAAGTVLVYGVK